MLTGRGVRTAYNCNLCFVKSGGTGAANRGDCLARAAIVKALDERDEEYYWINASGGKQLTHTALC